MAARPRIVLGSLAASVIATALPAWSADSLVFVPLPPCRVIDTRVVGAGGPLTAGSSRSFLFRGPTTNYQTPPSFPNQGGNTSGCGIPGINTADFDLYRQNIAKALAINIVVVKPSGPGDLRAFPANQPVPNASVLNYAAVTGLNIANGIIVPMCDEVSNNPCTGGDIAFQADVSGTHLVVDVTGYFTAGQPGPAPVSMRNTGLGDLALQATTTGENNSAFGYRVLYKSTTGSGNSALGTSALLYNSSGSANTGLGAQALEHNQTGAHDTAVGYQAMASNTSGAGNVAGGERALSNSNGSYNAAWGTRALASNTIASYNVAIGFNSLYKNTTGANNTALGTSALSKNTTGSGNIAIGYQAGLNDTSGSGNIFIGNLGVNADYGVIRIGSGQNATYMAGIRGIQTSYADAVPVLIDSAGELGTKSSSIRVKEDVHDLGATSERLFDLRPVSFRYKKPFRDGSRPIQFGLIAEEVEEVFPELVARDGLGEPFSVKYEDLPVLLLNEVKRDKAQLAAQAHRIDDLARRLGEKEGEAAVMSDRLRRLIARLEELEADRRAPPQTAGTAATAYPSP